MQTIKQFLNTVDLRNTNPGAIVFVITTPRTFRYPFIVKTTKDGKKWLKSNDNRPQELIASNPVNQYKLSKI